jgi:hypothetical protein
MAARQQLHRLALVALAALVLLSALVAPPARAAAPLQQVCYDLVVNGGFETPNAWVLASSPLPPAYTTSQPRTGAWAMQIGNVNPAQAAVQAYSSVRQTLTIPANAISAELTFWVWTFTEANPGSDRQEALLLVPGASVQSASPTTVWSELSNSGAYRQIRVPVTGQIGRTVDLTFSVYNDGFGGRTWMLVDDVALVVCIPSGTATPTATPTLLPVATPTPTPTSIPTPVVPSPIPPTCVDILANGGFEWDGAWQISQTAIPPFYAGPPNPVYSGGRSMALGAVLPSSPSNVASYSSIQQAVTLPGAAQTAQIRFWYYPTSSAAAGGFNRQELILLDPLNYNQTIEVLWRVTQNNNAWVYNEIDLTRFLGRTVTIYFNGRNAGDGTRTGMYLDQVQVLACNAMGVMPPAAFGEYPAALAEAGNYVWPEGQAPGAALSEAVVATAVALTGPTVVAVGTNAAPRPEATPETTPVSATATPESNRRDRQPIFDPDQLDSPWLIILVIGGVVLLAVVLALLFFRGDQSQAPPP